MTFLTRARGDSPNEAQGGPAGEERVLRLLESIDRRLALLTAADERDLRAKLTANVLRAGGRVALWNAIDAERNSQELARTAGVSERFAQLFVNELLELGLVRRVQRPAGRGTVVEKDELGAVDWYLGQSAAKGMAAP